MPVESSKLQLTIPVPCIAIFVVAMPVMVRSDGETSYSPLMNSERSFVMDIDDPESQMTDLEGVTTGDVVVVADRKHDGTKLWKTFRKVRCGGTATAAM